MKNILLVIYFLLISGLSQAQFGLMKTATWSQNRQVLSGQHHFVLGASAGPEFYLVGHDKLITPFIKSTTKVLNVGFGYKTTGYYYDKYTKTTYLGTGETNTAVQNKHMPGFLFKIDYIQRWGSASNTSEYIDTAGYYLYGGTPKNLKVNMIGLNFGLTKNMGKRNRTTFIGCLGYQFGTYNLYSFQSNTEVSEATFKAHAFDINMSFAFACSDHISILWDMFGAAKITASNDYSLKVYNGSFTPSPLSDDAEPFDNVALYTRIGLCYWFFKIKPTSR